MIQGKSVLAVIFARGGSKGVPRKNVRIIGGKPLIAWSIEAAKKSKYIDRAIFSSEDAEIIDVARRWGCEVPFVRPAELAEDHVRGLETVLHAIKMVPNYDYVCALQPTSPLCETTDIDCCIEFCLKHQGNVCVSVTEPDKTPYWMYTLTPEGRLIPVIKSDGPPRNRQYLPKVYSLNGAIQFAKTEWLAEKREFLTDETLAYPMPKERSLDIDTELDITLVEAIIAKKKSS